MEAFAETNGLEAKFERAGGGGGGREGMVLVSFFLAGLNDWLKKPSDMVLMLLAFVGGSEVGAEVMSWAVFLSRRRKGRLIQ